MEQTTSDPVKINGASSSSYRNKYEDTTDEKFKKHLLFGKNKSCFELVYIILLHHIYDSRYWYCYCQNRRGKCIFLQSTKSF